MRAYEEQLWAAAVVANHRDGSPIDIAIEKADVLVLLVREHVQQTGALHAREQLEAERGVESYSCDECGDTAAHFWTEGQRCAYYCEGCWEELGLARAPQ